MIHEFVRKMSAEERASLQPAMRGPAGGVQSSVGPPAAGLAAVAALAVGVAAWTGEAPKGGVAAALAGLGVYALYHVAAAAASDRRMRERRESHHAQNARVLARVLEDGRVTVKRVSATAVVELEPMEDEGTGYLFDLGDGRVLLLTGQDYALPDDEDDPWPNTAFEIVRTVVGGRLLALTCHGTALRPVRTVPNGELDPEVLWKAREEVLETSLDDAVRSVLAKP